MNSSDLLQQLCKWGYTVGWNGTMYWPVTVDGECLNWWDDPGQIAQADFDKTVEALYKEVSHRHFMKALKANSEEVRSWPEWKRNLLGTIGYETDC